MQGEPAQMSLDTWTVPPAGGSLASAVVRQSNRLARAPMLAKGEQNEKLFIPHLNPLRILHLAFSKAHRGLPADGLVKISFDELRQVLPSLFSHNSWAARLSEECRNLGALQYHETLENGDQVWTTLMKKVVLATSRREVHLHFIRDSMDSVVGHNVRSGFVQYRPSTILNMDNPRFIALYLYLKSYANLSNGSYGNCRMTRKELALMLDLPESTSSKAIVQKRTLEPFQAYCLANLDITFEYQIEGGYGTYTVSFAVSNKTGMDDATPYERAAVELLLRRGITKARAIDAVQVRGIDHCLRALIVTNSRRKGDAQAAAPVRNPEGYLLEMLDAQQIPDRQLPGDDAREALRGAFLREVHEALPLAERQALATAHAQRLTPGDKALFQSDPFGPRQAKRFLAHIDQQHPSASELAPFLWRPVTIQ